jgi:hypothetical protein
MLAAIDGLGERADGVLARWDGVTWTSLTTRTSLGPQSNG